MGDASSSAPGWAFPLRTDATGGIALVTREREIEQAIRLILGTAPGRAADAARVRLPHPRHVFAPGQRRDRRADRLRGAGGARPVGAADRRRRRRRSASTPSTSGVLYIDVTLPRSAARTTRATWSSRSTSSRSTSRP